MSIVGDAMDVGNDQNEPLLNQIDLSPPFTNLPQETDDVKELTRILEEKELMINPSSWNRTLDISNETTKNITSFVLNSSGTLIFYGTESGIVSLLKLNQSESHFNDVGFNASSTFSNYNSENTQMIQGNKENLDHGKINDLVLSNDEKFLYCATKKRKIFRIKINELKWEIEELDEVLKGTNTIVLSHDDKFLLSGSDDSSVRLYDLSDEKLQDKSSKSIFPKYNYKLFIGFTLDIKSVAFTKDSLKFLSASLEGSLKLWDIQNSSQPISTHSSKTGKIKKMILTNNDFFLVFGTFDGYVSVWLFEGMIEYHNFYAHSHPISTLLIIPNSHYVISTSKDSKIKILNLKEKFEEISIFFNKNIRECGKDIYEISYEHKSKRKATNAGKTEPIKSIQISKNSDFLIIATGKTFQILDIYQHPSLNIIKSKISLLADKNFGELKGHEGQVSVLLQCPKTQRIMSGSDDNSIIIWKNKTIEKKLVGHTGRIRCLAVDINEQFLYSGSHDRTVIKWNITDSNIEKFEDHGGFVWCLALFHQDSKLASATSEKLIFIWNAHTRTKLKVLDDKHFQLPITSIVVDNFSDKMITTSLDGFLKIWKLENIENSGNILEDDWKSEITIELKDLQDFWRKFRELDSRKQKNPEPQCAELNKKYGKYVVGCRKGFILVFDVEELYDKNRKEFKKLLVLLGHTSWVRGVRIIESNDDSYSVISVAYDCTIRVWKLSDHKIIAKSVTYSNNEQLFDICVFNSLTNENKSLVIVLTCSVSKDIKLWALDLLNEPSFNKTSNTTHSTPIKCMKILENLKILTGSEDGSLKIWSILKRNKENNDYEVIKLNDMSETHEVTEYFKFNYTVTHIEKLDNKKLIIALQTGSFHIFDIESAKENDYQCEECFSLYSEVGELLTFNEKLILCTKINKDEIFLYDLERIKETFSPSFIFNYSLTCLIKDSFDKENNSFFAASIDKGIYKFIIIPDNFPEISRNQNKIAEDLEGITKLCQISSNLIACALRDYSIVIWILDGNYKYRVFKGHTERITALSTLDPVKYPDQFISCSRDLTIRRWNIQLKRQVFQYLGHERVINDVKNIGKLIFSISDDKNLRYWEDSPKEKYWISKFSSPIENFLFFSRLQRKKLPDLKLVNSQFGVSNHTPLHYFMLNGNAKLVEQCLNVGVDILKNKYNKSPLAYCLSIERNDYSENLGFTQKITQTLRKGLKFISNNEVNPQKTDNSSNNRLDKGSREKCINIFLSFMINLCIKDKEKFIVSCCVLEDEFIELIKCSSVLLKDFFQLLMIKKTETNIPYFVKPRKFPLIDVSCSDIITLKQIEKLEKENPSDSSVQIELKQTPFRLPMKSGSDASKLLLRNLLKSKNQAIYNTPIIQFIIKFKWEALKWFIFLFSILNWTNFFFMTMVLFYKSSIIWVIFFIVNISILFLIELFQIVCAESLSKYFDFLNFIDLLRVFVSYVWVLMVFTVGVDDYILITWLMVLGNFIRGISGFKCFGITRYYIKLIKYAFIDTYSFIIIFLFSTLGFGILYMESTASHKDQDTFDVIWKTPYELNMGTFNTVNEILPYTTFMIASIVNVIIMLNLLISILGDSYSKFQANSVEVDTKSMAEIILELEELYLGRDSENEKMFINVIDVINSNKAHTWEGKIERFEKNFKRNSIELKSRIEKIENQISGCCKSIANVERYFENIRAVKESL